MAIRYTLSRTVGAVLAASLLSACAADTSQYPSLARRDAERMSGSAAVAAPDEPPVTTPAPPPATLPAKLTAIADSAKVSHATFLARAEAARARAQGATGAQPGTLAWSDAEVALSSLESARSDTMFALADLDSLLALGAVEEADSGEPAGLPEIVALREEIAALVTAEDAVLAQLRGL